ncbi:hypothetical protein G7Z17_g2686 [Cylindrodendrum hubeiense]|uniref:Uncharacterized protein n=1 Tax=Cylindrodendrum hubeiense TaxID=595255 RepID=A0A9P5LBG0_9HYPO|nr:hypothetical protein G7Z17_g2686 [Cylindrodendrum hubeiense]
MTSLVFQPGPIVTSRVFDEKVHNVTIEMKLPMVRWPGRDKLPSDRKSPEYEAKAHAAAKAFVRELENKLAGEKCPELLRLACLLMTMQQLEVMIPLWLENDDQGRFYAYASDELVQTFVANNWLTAGLPTVPQVYPDVKPAKKGGKK